MPFDNKRRLLQAVFDGKDAEGKRYGVYVSKIDGEFRFRINGAFGEISHKFPISKKKAQDILGIEREYDPDFDPWRLLLVEK